MSKRLAVAIAGAVSLGSYEAGVLWEVLDAIRQHNSDPQTPAGEKIEIDVITGASAGGMTAVILAQKLLYSAAEFKSAYDNPLYNTWVKRINLAELQKTGGDEKALQSVFSSDLIEEISEEVVMERYNGNAPPPAQPHAAVGPRLSIGLALTNLNGLAYTYPVTPGGEFTYIGYADQMTRQISAKECDNKPFWEKLRHGAVACGAFPIAFRPQAIERSKQEDPGDYNSQNLAWQGEPKTFTYSDGGIFQNQPLGMAKNLVDPIDCHLHPERFYLFVSPHAKDPTPVPFTTDEADYVHVVKRLIGATLGQSGFQDWITAREINQRVLLLDTRAEELMRTMREGRIEVKPLQTTSKELLDLLFPGGKHLPPGATKEEALADAQKRIAVQYASETNQLAGLPGAPDAFRGSILAFETAAGLGARDFMTIYGITAKEGELAGAGLESFLGFFDQRYRDHDYDAGRDHAQKILADSALSAAGQLGPFRYTPEAIRDIDRGLDGPQVHDLSEDDFKLFKKGMTTRVNQMLKEISPRLAMIDFAADLIVDWLVGRAVSPRKPDPSRPLGLDAAV